MTMGVKILVTGGTFDKEYDEITGKLYFNATHLPEILHLGRCALTVSIESLMITNKQLKCGYNWMLGAVVLVSIATLLTRN